MFVLKTGFVITAGVLAFLAVPLAAQAQGTMEGGAAASARRLAASGGLLACLAANTRTIITTNTPVSTETTLRGSVNILPINIATIVSDSDVLRSRMRGGNNRVDGDSA